MNPKYILVALAAALFQISVSTAGAAPIYWDGIATGGWNVASNWSTVSGATTPDPSNPPTTGDTAVFSGGATVSLNSATAVDGITFAGTGTVAIIDGGANQTLSIGAGGITSGANTTAVIVGSSVTGNTVSVALMADQAWSFNGANLSTSNGIFVRHAVSLGITGTHTLTLGGSSGSTAISSINGAISDGLGTLNITMNGADNNRWNLTVDNSYTGTTTITKGALGIQTANGLGTTDGGTSVAAGAALFIRSGSNTSYAAEALSITGVGPSGTSGRGALRHVSGATSTWFGPISANATPGNVRIGADNGTLILASAATITTTGANNLEFEATGTITVNGSITGTAGVSKVASPAPGVNATGVLTLAGNSSYTGATRVGIGTMVVNGTLANTQSVLVDAPGTLRGSGTINTAALATVNGTLGVGANASSVGTFTLGSVTFGGTGIFSVDFSSGTQSLDKLNVAGNLTINSGASLVMSDITGSSLALAIGTGFTLIDYSGTWNGGFFTVGGTVIHDELEYFTVGNNSFMIDYDGGANGNDVRLITVVPEPASAALLLGGFGLLAVRSRRRR